MRIREALVEIEALKFPYGLRSDGGVQIRTPRFLFVFREPFLSKNRVRQFRGWLSRAKSENDLAKLPFGIICREIRWRDWSKVPGAAIKPLAPEFPIRPVSQGGGGLHSTVPGHPAELDWFDLQRRH